MAGRSATDSRRARVAATIDPSKLDLVMYRMHWSSAKEIRRARATSPESCKNDMAAMRRDLVVNSER